MRHRLVLAASLAALTGCENVSQVLNPLLTQTLAAPAFSESFEAPATTNYTVIRAGQSFTTQRNTWHVTGGSVDIVNTGVRRETAPADGAQLIDLAGSPGAGVMSASFPTTPGQRYALAFVYGRNNLIGAKPALARVEVIGASTLLRSDLRHAAPTPFDALQRFSMAFVADSASTTLRFSSLVGGNMGVTIDAISVTSGAGAALARDRSGALASETIPGETAVRPRKF